MIIIAQTVGIGLTDLAVNEQTFASRTGLPFETFEYDGADWIRTTNGASDVTNMADYGITYTGTPVATDTIQVAQEPSQFWEFFAGDGINCKKLNENFAQLQQITNNNENSINNIANTALLRDGSNLTQSTIDAFQQETPIIISGNGDINLTDNKVHFLTLTGNNNNKVVLPSILPDTYSHTIVLIVAGGSYSLNVGNGTAGTMSSPTIVSPAQLYTVLYVFNKIDNNWYYCLGQ